MEETYAVSRLVAAALGGAPMLRRLSPRWLIPLAVVVLLLPSCTDSADDSAVTTFAPTTTAIETTTTAPAASTTTTTTAAPSPTTTLAELVRIYDRDDGFCSGYHAALLQMTFDAQDNPNDFYPLPDPLTTECPDHEMGSFGLEQAFCEGWASHTISGTIILNEDPNTADLMDSLWEACMDDTFVRNPEDTQDDDYSIYDLGIVCYPEHSYYWTNHPEIQPTIPWVGMCEN